MNAFYKWWDELSFGSFLCWMGYHDLVWMEEDANPDYGGTCTRCAVKSYLYC